MNGVLVVDKPSGPTSFDVVRRVRALLHLKKVGHTGTLDPLATGVLPLCLGDATRIAGFITEGDKAYDAVVKLGARTDTLDAQGKVLATSDVPPLGRPGIEAALQQFRGSILQTPPMYSAIKLGGKRLYELARAGEEVERAARQVRVHELLLRDFSSDELHLHVRCSKGFFVRVLAEELGVALGTLAHLKALRRVQSGPFTLQQASPLAWLEETLEKGEGGVAEVVERLVGPGEALAELPAVEVSAPEALRVTHGVPLEVRVQPGRVRVLGPKGALLAVAEAGPGGRLRYLRVLTQDSA